MATSDDMSLHSVLTCILCEEVLDDPKLLPCQHTFCSKCLKIYVRGQLRASQTRAGLPCPECRKTFSLPAGGVDHLTTNEFVNMLIKKHYKQLKETNGVRTCDENELAVVYDESGKKRTADQNYEEIDEVIGLNGIQKNETGSDVSVPSNRIEANDASSINLTSNVIKKSDSMKKIEAASSQDITKDENQHESEEEEEEDGEEREEEEMEEGEEGEEEMKEGEEGEEEREEDEKRDGGDGVRGEEEEDGDKEGEVEVVNINKIPLNIKKTPTKTNSFGNGMHSAVDSAASSAVEKGQQREGKNLGAPAGKLANSVRTAVKNVTKEDSDKPNVMDESKKPLASTTLTDVTKKKKNVPAQHKPKERSSKLQVTPHLVVSTLPKQSITKDIKPDNQAQTTMESSVDAHRPGKTKNNIPAGHERMEHTSPDDSIAIQRPKDEYCCPISTYHCIVSKWLNINRKPLTSDPGLIKRATKAIFSAFSKPSTPTGKEVSDRDSIDVITELSSTSELEYGTLENIAYFWTFLDALDMQQSFPQICMDWIIKFVTQQRRAQSKLQLMGALPFWNRQNARFSQPWNLNTVKEIRVRLSTHIRLIRKDFHPVMGKMAVFLTEIQFLQQKCIIQPPSGTYQPGKDFYPLVEVYPYISQKIKMLGCHVLSPDCFLRVVETAIRKEVSNTSGGKSVRKILGEKVPLSRIDFIALYIGTSDSLVALDIIQIMARFSIALPLIMSDIWKPQNVIMLPLLRDIVIKWESKPGNIVENYLFRSPFRMVVALRLGTNIKNKPGKTIFLNQVLQPKYFFSSRDEPAGLNGRPITADGTVEFTWLTRETCDSGLWLMVMEPMYTREATGNDEVILLANLHGDISKYMHYFSFFQSLACGYLIFVMPEVSSSSECLKSIKTKLSSTNHEYVYVSNADDESDESGDDDNDNFMRNIVIKTNAIGGACTSKIISKVLKKTIDGTSTVKNLDLDKVQTMQHQGLQLVQSIETSSSKGFINLIRKMGCTRVKQMMQQSRNSGEKTPVLQLRENPELNGLFQNFKEILHLPSLERKKAITHIERELSHLSSSEATVARREVIKCQNIARKEFLSNAEVGGKERCYEKQVSYEMQANSMYLKKAFQSVDEANLGLEHFFREFSRIYEIDCNNREVTDLPRYCAELLIDGCAIELMNGDSGTMSTGWIDAICKQVEIQHSKVKDNHKNLNVFVVSIIGLQSSGKSTLLNALFGCKFAVSVGRCTRGLFMRLVFLEPGMKEQCGFDALLVIDTEGLGSMEKKNEDTADQNDRKMATFAMGVSDLTIINIMGENMSEMTDILQIAILAMARLGKKDMASDILLVQHVRERNEGRLAEGKNAFCAALKDAFDNVRDNFGVLGVLDLKCLENLILRVQGGNFLKMFRPLSSGATPYARPSEFYHEDIVDLYKTIFDAARGTKGFNNLSHWSQISSSYWKVAGLEDFASRFKNIKEMIVFIEREQAVAKLKESIDLMFRCHREKLEILMREQINKCKCNYNKEQYMLIVNKQLSSYPQLCMYKSSTDVPEAECENCKVVRTLTEEMRSQIEGKDHERQTLAVIESHRDLTGQNTRETLLQMFDASQVKDTVYNEITNQVSEVLKKTLKDQSKSHVILDTSKRAQEAKKVWETIANKMYGGPPGDSFDAKFTRDLDTVYRNVGEFSRMYKVIVSIQELMNDDAIDRQKTVDKHGKYTYGKFANCRSLPYEIVKVLTSRLQESAKLVFSRLQANRYEQGLIDALRKEIARMIASFAEEYKVVFIVNYTWKLHVYTLHMFYNCAKEKEKEWNRTNNPHVVLKNMKEDIMQQIDSRLQYGFSSASDGLIAGKVLANSNQIDAKNVVEKFLEKKVLDSAWTLNAEEVRLTFFEELVKEIQNGKKTRALKYFGDPQSEIEKWYIESVDVYQEDEAQALYEKHVAEGLEHHHRTIINNKLDEIQEHIESCVSRTDLKFNVDLTQYQEEQDVARFKQCVNEALSLERGDVRVKFTLPSKMPKVNGLSNLVMGRLGCTETCTFCGAMCWCARGHDVKIDGKTELQHCTSHQPAGLHHWCNKVSKELKAIPCYKRSDEAIMHYGKYRAEGIKWEKVKNEEFPNWKFCSYDAVRDFEELMRWFFYMLHNEIAAAQNSQPCPEAELEECGCIGVDIEAVLKRMRRK